MIFQGFNTATSTKAPTMGFRSPLLLAKLGFDLRRHYEELLSAPLPDELSRLVNKLDEREVPRASLR